VADLDHLVYATPDLDASIAQLEARLRVRAAFGGRHLGRGTRNALIALSDFSYLEIIGPDPSQTDISGPRWFSVDTLTEPRLLTWAVKSIDVERTASDAARNGVVLGRVASGSRETAAGTVLRWQLTDPGAMVDDGIVPFFIDWGNSPHPASSAPRGLSLKSLRAEHPEPERVGRVLSIVGATLSVSKALGPALIATLSTPLGDVELR
jgi:hypothetical protein